MRSNTLRPQITVSRSEHSKLLALAAAGAGPTTAAAESLLNEMERARVVPDQNLTDDYVRMGSKVQYRTDKDETLEVELVYPAQADILQNKVSVLTPVGAALIGLRLGQSITWESRGGKRHVLTVLSVSAAAKDQEEV